MKKILFIILLFVIVSADAPQPQYSYTWLRAQDITNTRNFIWQGDTIDFSTFGAQINDVDFEDDSLKFYSNEVLIATVYFDYAQSIDTFQVIGDSIKLKLTDSEAKYLNINFINEKMDTVAIDSTLKGNGTAESPLGIDETILADAMKTNYTIDLPSAGTIAGRIAAATEGTDYPTGWVLAAGTNSADLSITHGLGKRVFGISVWSVDGTEHTQLYGNAAYSGVKTEENSILIEALATVTTDISIQIVFVQ